MTLMLHCGGVRASMSDLAAVPVPPPSGIWAPIGHHEVVAAVEDRFSAAGYRLTARSLGMAKHGAQMFGVSTFAPQMPHMLPSALRHLDNDIAVGYRNSMNKTLAVGLVTGARVFVCDNLALCGEVKRVRKHTTNLHRDMDVIIGQVLEGATRDHRQINVDFAAMSEVEVSDKWAFRLLGEALGRGLLTSSQTTAALREWRRPSHDEWAERSDAWRWYAGATEALKRSRSVGVMTQYTGVHELAMEHCHVALRAAA
jgi:hypothetical protein